MKKETAGVNWNIGPPFRPMNSCPSSSKLTPITVPPGPGITLVMREFLKMPV